MGLLIQVKRGAVGSIPILSDGEFGWTTADRLFVGDGSANHEVSMKGHGFHVPSNGTGNAGKSLTATAIDGVFSWENATSGTVTDVTATAPVASTEGTSPNISMVAASDAVDGYMTGVYATKLDGIDESANDYSHPSGDGNLHVPVTSTNSEDKVLTAGATAGVFSWQTPATTYTHPSDGGGNIGAQTGATVISQLTVNTAGHVTGTATRELTPANIGALPLTGGTLTGGLVVEDLYTTGSIDASEKHFRIPHPTPAKTSTHILTHGSLEGPENGVYVRGTIEGNVIELPSYWVDLVHADSITCTVTPFGKPQKLFIKQIADNKVIIGKPWYSFKKIKAQYFIQATRKDVKKLEVEQKNV